MKMIWSFYSFPSLFGGMVHEPVVFLNKYIGLEGKVVHWRLNRAGNIFLDLIYILHAFHFRVSSNHRYMFKALIYLKWLRHWHSDKILLTMIKKHNLTTCKWSIWSQIIHIGARNHTFLPETCNSAVQNIYKNTKCWVHSETYTRKLHCGKEVKSIHLNPMCKNNIVIFLFLKLVLELRTSGIPYVWAKDFWRG